MNEKFNSLSDERKKKIINGAMKCFSIHGYGKASMADIAKEAAVSKALLFHYFETKKDLFLYLWNLTAEKTRESQNGFSPFLALDGTVCCKGMV